MRRIPLEAAVAVLQRLNLHPRDLGLLDSALERPITQLYGSYVYSPLAMAAAAQTESIARNHALLDGNKRAALIFLTVFLRLNGMRLSLDNDGAYTLIMGIATGETSLAESAQVIGTHLMPWES